MISYVTLGAEVGYVSYGSFGIVSSGFSRVVKINKWGHIKLENGKEFDKFGRARNKEYSRLQLIEASELREQLQAQEERRDRRNAVKCLIDKLNSTFTYSGDVHVSPELKQELIQLVNQL